MKSRLSALTLGLMLGLGALTSPALAYQKTPDPPQKEVTDGFFDVPARDPSEESEPWGLPSYMITSALGGLGIFILCKSARR
ncbi:hypothetical protein P12x_005444 [Tundrisphaera lichenicola]|uniref:hypothetical protein n=1 Tax=Tundrisphaera lichenicola TaxID=2029860 RepID=UPI003EBF710A